MGLIVGLMLVALALYGWASGNVGLPVVLMLAGLGGVLLSKYV